ncbi:MAG: VIT1/CCC1 transporter family protein [Candidatus Bathyarchaeia archaeon]
MDEWVRRAALAFEESELTEYEIYSRLSGSVKDPRNSEVLSRIADEELTHHLFWRDVTGEDVKPSRWKILFYSLVSRLFGLSFGLKLMEKGEEQAQAAYTRILGHIQSAERIIEDENRHEAYLINLIDEEKLRYVGSMVLGLNDALVELTGALAGLTLTFKDARLIAVVGLITGLSASLSMAASEYLSTKSEEDTRNPYRASAYTGLAYVITVSLLILPYLIFSNPILSLCATIINAITIIAVFTFYTSIAKDLPFKKRLIEMVSISLGVAALTSIIGFLLKNLGASI